MCNLRLAQLIYYLGVAGFCLLIWAWADAQLYRSHVGLRSTGMGSRVELVEGDGWLSMHLVRLKAGYGASLDQRNGEVRIWKHIPAPTSRSMGTLIRGTVSVSAVSSGGPFFLSRGKALDPIRSDEGPWPDIDLEKIPGIPVGSFSLHLPHWFLFLAYGGTWTMAWSFFWRRARRLEEGLVFEGGVPLRS